MKAKIAAMLMTLALNMGAQGTIEPCRETEPMIMPEVAITETIVEETPSTDVKEIILDENETELLTILSIKIEEVKSDTVSLGTKISDASSAAWKHVTLTWDDVTSRFKD